MATASLTSPKSMPRRTNRFANLGLVDPVRACGALESPLRSLHYDSIGAFAHLEQIWVSGASSVFLGVQRLNQLKQLTANLGTLNILELNLGFEHYDANLGSLKRFGS